MGQNTRASRILDIILFVSIGIPLLLLFGVFLPTTSLLTTNPTIKVDTMGLSFPGVCGIIVSLAFFMPGLEVIYEKYFAPHAQDGPNSSDIDAQVTEVDTFQSYGPELVERRMRIPEEPIQLGRLENTTLINQSTWKRERYNI